MSVPSLRRSFPAVLFLSAVFAALGQPPGQTSPAAGMGGFVPPAPHVNAPLGNIPRKPGDGAGAYATHNYRDLFAEAGHSPTETRTKIEKAFQQLFHGDQLAERVYFEAGSNENGPLAFITDWANNDARSEGMSYGMMIAVQMDKKHEFDALWNWSNTYMKITDPNNPDYGFFAWSIDPDGTPRSAGPAPDGEEYYAMALLFAAHRWGNGEGIYNYQEQADRILHEMVHHTSPPLTGPFKVHPSDPPMAQGTRGFTSPNNTERQQAQADLAIELKGEGKTPAGGGGRFGGGGFGGGGFGYAGGARPVPRPTTGGPMMEPDYYMPRFTAGVGPSVTDSSYHLPAFYELFARWGPAEDREYWAKAADVSRDMFPKVVGANTGLSPDRNNFDETEILGRDGQPTSFGYDSWRTVSNWSVDYSWWHKAPQERDLSNRIQKFLIGQGISTFPDRYTLDGKPLSSRHSTGMLAAATVGGLAANPGPNEKAFVAELWRTPIPNGEQRYFDGMLYLMSMLHCSGNFRIIEPHGTSRADQAMH